MKGAISVVDLQVSAGGAIRFHMNRIHRHGVGIRAENSWLIHIVPEAVHVVASFELIIRE